MGSSLSFKVFRKSSFHGRVLHRKELWFSLIFWTIFLTFANIWICSKSDETEPTFRSKHLLTKNLSEPSSSSSSLASSSSSASSTNVIVGLDPNVDQTTRLKNVERGCNSSRRWDWGTHKPEVSLLTDNLKSVGYCHVPKVASSAWSTS